MASLLISVPAPPFHLSGGLSDSKDCADVEAKDQDPSPHFRLSISYHGMNK